MKKLLGLVVVGASALAMASTVTACDNYSTQEKLAIGAIKAEIGLGSKDNCSAYSSSSSKSDCEASYENLKEYGVGWSIDVLGTQTNINTYNGTEYTIATIKYKYTGKSSANNVTIDYEGTMIDHFMFLTDNKIKTYLNTYKAEAKPTASTDGSLDTFDKFKKAA